MIEVYIYGKDGGKDGSLPPHQNEAQIEESLFFPMKKLIFEEEKDSYSICNDIWKKWETIDYFIKEDGLIVIEKETKKQIFLCNEGNIKQISNKLDPKWRNAFPKNNKCQVNEDKVIF